VDYENHYTKIDFDDGRPIFDTRSEYQVVKILRISRSTVQDIIDRALRKILNIISNGDNM